MTVDKGPILGVRHIQTLLLFLTIVIFYAARVNVSVSLVAMTDANTTNPNFYEFDWNEKQKSYIQSSFFWGYTLAQVPGGCIARRVGVKLTILIGIFLNSLLTLLSPISVYWGGWGIFCAIRVLQGFCQGALFPSVFQHLAKWSPVEERNRLGSLCTSGIQCGMIVAMYFAGIIAASNLGWPGIFYVFGGCGLVFNILWFIFAENTPGEAKFITTAEKSYILNSQRSAECDEGKKRIPVPWRAMLTSCSLLSLVIVRLCDNWGYDTMMTQVPIYLHGILKMDISSNAFYSTMPYVLSLFFSYFFMIVADVVLTKKWTSLLVLRKCVNTISMWGPGTLLIGVTFLGENQRALTLTFIMFSVGLNGGFTIGNLMNLIDLSPNHAGILTALLNTSSCFIAVICPLINAAIVYDETDRSLWQIVFILAGGLYILGNLQFLFFAQTDPQPWDDENFLTSKISKEEGNTTESPLKETKENNNVQNTKL